MTKQTNSLIDSAVALAAITALLYSISTAYYGGYFGTLQLDDNILDRSLQQSLYHGFVISFIHMFTVLWGYAVIRLAYSQLLPELNDMLRHSRGKRRLFLKLKHLCLGKRKDSEIERYQKNYARTVIFYAGVFTLLLFSLVYFESEGKEKANTVLKKKLKVMPLSNPI